VYAYHFNQLFWLISGKKWTLVSKNLDLFWKIIVKKWPLIPQSGLCMGQLLLTIFKQEGGTFMHFSSNKVIFFPGIF
jgi:hypothetical protein